MFTCPWGYAKNAVEKVWVYDQQFDGDRVFVLKDERPRETDILVFDDGHCGHVVAVRDGIKKVNETALEIPIIEQNVASCSTDYRRVLTAQADASGKWSVDSGFKAYKYSGLIRHNLAGVYGDCGFHGVSDDCFPTDKSSQAFRDAYQRVRKETGISIGWAFDNGGGPFVHPVGRVLVQDFVNGLPDEPHFGTDGQTALAYNAALGRAFLLKEGFWAAYKCLPGVTVGTMGGAEWLGAPTGDEKTGRIDARCEAAADEDAPEVAYQRFERGCLWWRDAADGKVHVHLGSGEVPGPKLEAASRTCGLAFEANPPGADCRDECTAGERRCDGGDLLQCGRPGPGPCYGWLRLACATGLVCGDGACAATEQPAPPPGPCVHHARRCGTDPRSYEVCLMNYEGPENRELGTEWGAFPCPDGQVCVGGGDCAAPEPPPADPDVPGGGAGGASGGAEGPTPDPRSQGGGAGGGGGTEGPAPTGGTPNDGGGGKVPVPQAQAAGAGGAGGAAEEAAPGPTDPDDPPHTVRCSALPDGTTLVAVTGPILDGLALMEDPAGEPSALTLGADGVGWPGPVSVPWLGDGAVHEIALPPGVASFNLYLAGPGGPDWDPATGTGTNAWLRLYEADGSPWSATGDCAMGAGLVLVLPREKVP